MNNDISRKYTTSLKVLVLLSVFLCIPTQSMATDDASNTPNVTSLREAEAWVEANRTGVFDFNTQIQFKEWFDLKGIALRAIKKFKEANKYEPRIEPVQFPHLTLRSPVILATFNKNAQTLRLASSSINSLTEADQGQLRDQISDLKQIYGDQPATGFIDNELDSEANKIWASISQAELEIAGDAYLIGERKKFIAVRLNARSGNFGDIWPQEPHISLIDVASIPEQLVPGLLNYVIAEIKTLNQPLLLHPSKLRLQVINVDIKSPEYFVPLEKQ